MEALFSIFADCAFFGYGVDRAVIEFIDNGLIRVRVYRGNRFNYSLCYALGEKYASRVEDPETAHGKRYL